MSQHAIDLSRIVYPNHDAVMQSLRMLRDSLREDLDCDPTGVRRIDVGPCPHARPGDPLCDACLSVSDPRKDQ